MVAFLLFLCVLVISVQNICLKEFNRLFMANTASFCVYSIGYELVAIAVFLCGFRPGPVHGTTIVFAVAYGVLYVFTFLFYTRAFSLGPFSFTSLLFSFSVSVPVFFGITLWRERVGWLHGAGFALLALTFWLCSEGDESDGESGGGEAKKKANARWLALSSAAMLGNGLVMTSSKAQQVATPGQDIRAFMIIAFATSALLCAVLLALRLARHKDSLSHLRVRRFPLLLLTHGVFAAASSLLFLYLSGVTPAVVQFPVTNGGVLLCSAAAALLLYREKVTPRKAAGMAVGLASIVLLCAA